MSRLPGEKFRNFFLVIHFAFFLVNALCKFGHRKLPLKIYKTITAGSLGFGQLKGNGE